MKYKIVTLFALLNFIPNMQAQSEVLEYKPLKDFDFRVADYIKYNFEERKAAYIGKPLSELLKNCEVPIKSTLERGYASVAGLYGTSFYFEDDDIRQYRRKYDKGGYDMPEIKVHWRDTIFCPFRGKFRDEILTWYSEQIVDNIETFGKNFSELPKIELEEEMPPPTPCCAPEQVTGLTLEEKKTRAQLANNFNWLDAANCYDGSDCSATKLSDLFDIAKNNFQEYSIVARDGALWDMSFWGYITQYTLENRYRKGPLEPGVPNWKYGDVNYFNDMNSTQTWQTVPASYAGHYKFSAPSGYDLYNFLKNRARNNTKKFFNYAYFVAYDESVYCLRVTGETKVYSPGSSYQEIIADREFQYNGSLFVPKDRDDLTLWWGFIDGGRMQDEFIDAFLRIYDEGSNFSKEDAYSAAFAYIMKGRGVELYRRAKGETSFRLYSTIPLYETGTEKISGFKSKIK